MYVVDRVDVQHPPTPPFAAITLPSLTWAEVQVEVRGACWCGVVMSRALQCPSRAKHAAVSAACTACRRRCLAAAIARGRLTGAASGRGARTGRSIGARSLTWCVSLLERACMRSSCAGCASRADVLQEWRENVEAAAAMKEQVESLEEASRLATNCSALNTTAASSPADTAPASEVSDGSVAGTPGNMPAPLNCSAEANGTTGITQQQQQHGRRLAVAPHVLATDTPATRATSNVPAAALAAAAAVADARGVRGVLWAGAPFAAVEWAPPAARRMRLQQAALPSTIDGWSLGCWYCFANAGYYYSNNWFYRYW